MKQKFKYGDLVYLYNSSRPMKVFDANDDEVVANSKSSFKGYEVNLVEIHKQEDLCDEPNTPAPSPEGMHTKLSDYFQKHPVFIEYAREEPTIRDMVAMHAINGLLAQEEPEWTLTIEKLVRSSFRIADEYLKQRNNKY